jgi:hypothetical protein
MSEQDNRDQQFHGQETEAISVLDLQKTLENASASSSVTETKIQMLSMAKDVLERNAALQWEQDKTRGLTITVDEIIDEAKKLLDFVME